MRARTVALKIRLAIDPRDVNETEITESTVGTVDGEFVTVTKLLDIYNQARRALFQAMQQSMSPEAVSVRIPGNMYTSNVTMTQSAGIATGALPTDFIRWITMEQKTSEGYVHLRLRPNTDIARVLDPDNNPDMAQSTTKMFVFLDGRTITHFGTYVVSSSGDVSHPLRYYAVREFSTSDIAAAATTEESFQEGDVPSIIELAKAIANGLDQTGTIDLAKKLIGAPGGN